MNFGYELDVVDFDDEEVRANDVIVVGGDDAAVDAVAADDGDDGNDVDEFDDVDDCVEVAVDDDDDAAVADGDYGGDDVVIVYLIANAFHQQLFRYVHYSHQNYFHH